VKNLIAGVVLFLASCVATAVDFTVVRSFVRPLTQGSQIFCSAVMLQPGLALTAEHCIAAYTPPNSTVVARGNDNLDYALLGFTVGDALCPCVRLAEREADIDEVVYVVGYPRGITQVVTLGHSQGVVSSPELPYGRRLVITAQVAGGNSGGGVFVLRDGEFQLVGLLVEAVGHLSFAVPLADLRPFLNARNVL
jgi:V8-like Glu-specific endopeptidase